MKNLFVVIIISIFIFSSCAPKPGSPEAKLKIAKKIEEQKTESASTIVSDLPDWCNNVPISEYAHYACGIGESSNLSVSRTRANLNAKSQIADMIDSEISARMEDFKNSLGTGLNEQVKEATSIIVKNVIVEAKLIGYKQKQSETQNVGSKYIHYVLLEYPVGPANQALLNQIKQNEILSTQKSADEALAELEAEINKKK